jgi:hypothetical protein
MLRAGDWVEVKSADEILATLDERGCLDQLPFMPEMLRFCGQRYRVYKTAHKTCNTIDKVGPAGRRMRNAVHLENLRCDGMAHGGCQAACLLFWKEAWLRPAPDERGRVRRARGGSGLDRVPSQACTPARLDAATSAETEGRLRYVCQATELKRATEPLSDWDLRQYVRDVTSGNVRLREMPGPFLHWLFTKTSRFGAYRLQRTVYDALQTRCGGTPFAGSARPKRSDRTPTGRLDLRAGESVRVRSYREIAETLDHNSKNRGLWFDEEMAASCGHQGRVLSRVDRIINEATGEMMEFQNPCIVIEGVFCRARYTRGRYFCPRSIYSYWREIWLERTESSAQAKAEPD